MSATTDPATDPAHDPPWPSQPPRYAVVPDTDDAGPVLWVVCDGEIDRPISWHESEANAAREVRRLVAREARRRSARLRMAAGIGLELGTSPHPDDHDRAAGESEAPGGFAETDAGLEMGRDTVKGGHS
jgi:hypothetical protein